MESFSAQTMNLEGGFHGNERFELRECLGEGALGVVYRAHDKERGRGVALKVLRNLGPDSAFYFKQEFRALESLAHPNLVHYRELFEDRGRWFLSMDLVDGVTLREYVRGGQVDGPLAGEQLERLREGLLGVAAALRTLHGAGKVHSDIKPSNLRIDEAGRAVLLDFGLASDGVEAPPDRDEMTPEVAAYLSPEQASGREPGPESDWYGVGVLLYECLTGRPPFAGAPEQVLDDKCAGPPPPPSTYAAPLPADLETLCLELLSQLPEQRRGAIARFERVLGSRPSTLPPQPLSLPRHARFVGRERELTQLEELVLDHVTPGLRLSLVFGESGLGKTALLEELWSRVGERHPEVRVLSGFCYERETLPYNALHGVIEGLVDLLCELPGPLLERLLPDDAACLPWTFPAFERLESLAVGDEFAPARPDAGQRRRAFRALRELLVRVSLDASLVVTIDDVQWADADSLQLIEALFGGEGAPRCLLLCSGRTRPAGSEPVARVLRRVEQGARARCHVHLRPLPADEAKALSQTELAGAPDGDLLAERIAEETGGHPLFIEVLTRHCREAGAESPPTLAVALEVACERLEPGAQRLAEVLALSGAPLPESAARQASRLTRAGFARALSALGAEGWVRVQRRPGGVQLGLVHERMRMSVSAGIEDTARAELHWEIGQALVECGGDTEPTAMHFAEAGDAERAQRFALAGAATAAKGCAFAHAERLYLLALRHVPADDLVQRRRIELELAHVHHLAGRGREAGDLYAELSRRSAGRGALSLRYRAAESWLDSGYYEEGLPFVRQLLADLGTPVTGSALTVGLRSVQAKLEAFARRGSPAFRDDESLSAPDRYRVDALFKLTCAMLTAEPGRSRPTQALHLAHALRLGDPYRAARAYALEVWLNPQSARTRGRFGLDSNLAAARRLSRTSDAPHARALTQLAEGVLCLSDDRYAEASARFSAAELQFTEHCPGARWERTYASYYGALCGWHMGEFWRVRDAVELALHDAAAHGDVLAEALWRCRLGHVPALLEGRVEAAVLALQPPTGPTRRLPHADLHALLSRVEVDLYRNDAWAFDQLETAWEQIARAGSLRVRSTRRRALWTRARAALCSARLHGNRRAELLKVAHEMARRLAADGTPAAQARAALVDAAVLELRGRRYQARDAYVRASALAEAAGCWAMVATADGRRAELSGQDGAALRERAHMYLRRAGARQPGRMAALINGF